MGLTTVIPIARKTGKTGTWETCVITHRYPVMHGFVDMQIT